MKRIWKNKKALIDTLQKDLEKALRGDADEVIDKISKDFNVAKGKVGRLVMTESAFFSSASRKECFNELGVEKYINMLSQGCTKKSIDLLKMVDVDLEDIHTYDSIVQFYRNKIEELKSLT